MPYFPKYRTSCAKMFKVDLFKNLSTDYFSFLIFLIYEHCKFRISTNFLGVRPFYLILVKAHRVMKSHSLKKT